MPLASASAYPAGTAAPAPRGSAWGDGGGGGPCTKPGEAGAHRPFGILGTAGALPTEGAGELRGHAL